jgi:glutamate-ammonia-ligase adenylyltransferase
LAAIDEKVESLLRDLPDAEGARLFFERLAAEHPRAARSLLRDAGLLSDVLALAAWSPLLAITMAQHPDYLQWLARERTHARVRTREELAESLARFQLTHSQLDPHLLLARFRRRELLRIYLRDIRRISTLVETTEELSNLADAILEHALTYARQEMDNRYGVPRRTTQRGRTATATVCIVALGKLGSCELNYASDIDLLFLYSDDGETDGTGTRGVKTTNREYFIKLAEWVVRVVGQPVGEGAAYRVDLRLRPHGRDGVLASSLDEAVRYYSLTAQPWERQALIRSRAAAGDRSLYASFNERVRYRIYAAEETVAQALANVRLAKQKIDRHHARDTGGFNVKLGRGGIREIEFIAQALQLSLGGRDEWLRAPHTLISLSRLADRRLLTEAERTSLSDAYLFLRTLEHRLQMEHGLQTHTVPDDPARRTLVARRMNFTGTADALGDFDRALHVHTSNVRAIYERVFAQVESEQLTGAQASPSPARPSATRRTQPHGLTETARIENPFDAEAAAVDSAALVFAAHMAEAAGEETQARARRVAQVLRSAAHASLNPHRALRLASRIASSLDKSSAPVWLTEDSLRTVTLLCGGSEYFGDMMASLPTLVSALPATGDAEERPRARALLFAAVEAEETFRAELAALRRAWAQLLVQTGALDAAGEISMRESNRRQTELAEASLDAGCLIAQRELERRHGSLDAPPHLAVLGLGRLGGGGMDYGSDLDVVLIYDDAAPSPLERLTHREAYARFAELLVGALSSLTREGSLYRMDLRLRPDGKNGPNVSGARSFTEYLAGRALPWEWLAYVKLRATAGDAEMGRRVEAEAREIIHAAARTGGDALLCTETRRVRERLEQEKTKRRASHTTDIKYGRGGMLDVYFATRYLQLRDYVPDQGTDRSTRTTLERLRAAGSLDEQDFLAMNDGYSLIRTLDHHLRLVVGRSTRLPATDHPALEDIARRMGYSSSAELTEAVKFRMEGIRVAYDNITSKVKG